MTEKNYTRYFIFKTDNLTGKTTHICNGGYDSCLECERHFRIYSYGFMDLAFEVYGAGNFQMSLGRHRYSFILKSEDKIDVEYFMLLGEEGHKMVMETCK